MIWIKELVMIGEISTDESLYVTTLSGDTYLWEVRENNGLVTISFGDILNITVSKSEAYDIVDAISLVLSSMEGSRWKTQGQGKVYIGRW